MSTMNVLMSQTLIEIAIIGNYKQHMDHRLEKTKVQKGFLNLIRTQQLYIKH